MNNRQQISRTWCYMIPSLLAMVNLAIVCILIGSNNHFELCTCMYYKHKHKLFIDRTHSKYMIIWQLVDLKERKKKCVEI